LTATSTVHESVFNMTWDWQQVVAVACVIGAVCLLCRRVYSWWKAADGAGCGSGCSTCSAKDSLVAVNSKPLVALDLRRPEKSADQSRN
jgi:hypothetical protein